MKRGSRIRAERLVRAGRLAISEAGAKRRWILAGVGALVVVTVVVFVISVTGSGDATSDKQQRPVDTATVERGKLSNMVSLAGTLTYSAQLDGSPYTAINQASGTYTMLPEAGDQIGCGGVLYRVDDRPVLLLCGTVPAYRALDSGDQGNDVRQLNRNLHRLRFDRAAGVRINPNDRTFTSKTHVALRKLQHARGLSATGKLAVADVVVLPASARISNVASILGGVARPGTPIAEATSDTLIVQVNLDPSQQGDVKQGARAQITLPGNTSVTGKVAQLGTIATIPQGQDNGAADATVPAIISLDDPTKARGLDEAPVQVDITTQGVDDALSVPVAALVGKAGGGFAVEIVKGSGERELVAVQIGLFDTGGGRVQVEGDLHKGDHVAVPSL